MGSGSSAVVSDSRIGFMRSVKYRMSLYFSIPKSSIPFSLDGPVDEKSLLYLVEDIELLIF